MEGHGDDLQIRCHACSWRAVCDHREQLRRLHQARMLLREREPDVQLVRELFRSAARRFHCDACGAEGLIVELPDEESLDWGPGRQCEECGEVISGARLEVFPDTTRCATCQSRAEQAQLQEPMEYCPKCGSAMTIRASGRSGLARYELGCPDCRG